MSKSRIEKVEYMSDYTGKPRYALKVDGKFDPALDYGTSSECSVAYDRLRDLEKSGGLALYEAMLALVKVGETAGNVDARDLAERMTAIAQDALLALHEQIDREVQ